MEYFEFEDVAKLFTLVDNLKGVEQGEEWHPEGDAYTHSLQCAVLALREGTDPDLIFAALVHDVGKATGSKGHADDYARPLLEGLVSIKTMWLVENHMRVRHYLAGEMNKLSTCQFLCHHPWFPELIQLYRWDTMARRPGWVPDLDAVSFLDRLNRLIDLRWARPEEDGSEEDEKGI